jgi:outer membrane receptor protein involved in Fe transport
MLAMVTATLLPLTATGQRFFPFHHHRENDETPEVNETIYKYEVYAGYGYTSLNQVNGSRYGLQGVELTVTRDWGKHFGMFADGASYKYPIKPGNPGNPSVDAVLFGPVFEAKLLGKTSMFARLMLGAEHSGGEDQTPNISFAGGAGVGMDYKLGQHFFLRAAGDDIASSFSLIDNNPELAYSPHRTRSSRATFGIIYKF